MEADAASLLNQIAQFGAQAVGFAESLLTPGWRQYQVFIIIGLLALAQGASWVLMPRLREQMRELEGWPKWRLRALLVLHRRTRLILFVVLAWGTTWFMRETTWPSRSYLIGVVATLATAWLLVGLAARLVRNPFLRKVVTWVLWAYATIYILGLSGDVSAFLDDIAVDLLNRPGNQITSSDIESVVRHVGVKALISPIMDQFLLINLINLALMAFTLGFPFFLFWLF